jgi:hypothetical protein
MEVIEFPDVEGMLLTYLNTAYAADATFPSVRASVNVPKNRPDEFTRLYSVGGSTPLPVLQRVTVVIDCYALKSVRASALMRRTLAYFLAIEQIAGVQFYDPQIFAGPANLPDPNVATQSRYTATASIGARGTAL